MSINKYKIQALAAMPSVNSITTSYDWRFAINGYVYAGGVNRILKVTFCDKK